ncbi:MAG: carbohydrate ABC transporter permease [Desulfobacteraceae bacterium]|nr:MAG: carbohydrate ABC transporter permease [Desulfobacteraceae bacterium]
MGYFLNSIKKSTKWIAILICLFFVLFPIYWAISSSFKMRVDIINPEQKFIFSPTLEAYGNIFRRRETWKCFRNSLVICSITMFLTFLLGTPASYVIGRYYFRHKDVLQFWIYSLRFLPASAALLPFLVVWRSLGLFDTYFSICFTYLIFTLPVFIILAIQQFKAIPPEIEEAAKLDGCGPFKVLRKISFPIVLPLLCCIAVLSFTLVWNDFMFAFILTRDLTPLPVYTAAYAWIGMSVPWPEVCAIAFFLTLPPIILLVTFRRFLIQFFSGK